ncbi:MAG: hypothetical protein WBB29_03640 [Geitlerinemataceae cyanobacterium]
MPLGTGTSQQVLVGFVGCDSLKPTRLDYHTQPAILMRTARDFPTPNLQ